MLLVVDTESGTNQPFATKDALIEWAMKQAPSDFGASGRVKYLEGLLVDMFGVLEKEIKGIKGIPKTECGDAYEKLHTRIADHFTDPPLGDTSNLKSFLSPISTNVDPLKKDTNKTPFQKKIEAGEIFMGTSLEDLEKEKESEETQEETKEEKFDRLMNDYLKKKGAPSEPIDEVFGSILGVTDLSKVEKDTSEIKQRMIQMERCGAERVRILEENHKVRLTDLVDWFAEKFCEPTIKENKPEEDWEYQNMLIFTDLCWKLFIRNPEGICSNVLKQVLPVKIKTLLETISEKHSTCNFRNITDYIKSTGFKQIELELTSIQNYQPGLLIKEEYFQEFRTVYTQLLDGFGEKGGLGVNMCFNPLSYNNTIYINPRPAEYTYERFFAVKDLFDTYDLFLRGELSADITYKWMFRCCQEKYVKCQEDMTGIRSSEIDTEVRGYFSKVFGSIPKLEEKLLSFLTPQFFSKSMAKMEFNKVRRGKGYYYTNILTKEDAIKKNIKGSLNNDATLNEDAKKSVPEIGALFMEIKQFADSNILAGAPYL